MTVRTLVLMRHGKSGYPPGVWDHDRPLADRGIREAALAGEWMSDDGLNVDMTLCSTATRTRQTLMRTGVDAPTIFIDDIYGGSPFEILEAIRIHVPHDAATVLVVGHEPGMPATALTLDPDGKLRLRVIRAEEDSILCSAEVGGVISNRKGGIGLEPGGGTLRALRIPRE